MVAWGRRSEIFYQKLKKRSSFILIAFDGEKAVGYILMKLERVSWRVYNPMVELTNLSVDPMYRGQGVGTKLFQHAKAIMKKRGVKRISVQALTDNIRALKFYQTMGFKDFSVILLMNVE